MKKWHKVKISLLVVSTLGLLAAFFHARIPDPYSSIYAVNVSNVIRAGHTNQYPVRSYLVAEFDNNILAAFYKQSMFGSTMWKQVGPGWDEIGAPPSSVCDAVPNLPECQPPGPTSTSAIFLGCHQPKCALWRFGMSASGAQKYRIQSSPYGGTSWSTWKVTSSNNYLPHLAQNPRRFRIRGENSAGVGPWRVFYTTGECGGSGGPGGGGPLD